MTRIYKIIGVLLLIAVLVTACGKTEPKWEDHFTRENADNVCVGIQVGEEGYYSTSFLYGQQHGKGQEHSDRKFASTL